jgi:hypothetical protein
MLLHSRTFTMCGGAIIVNTLEEKKQQFPRFPNDVALEWQFTLMRDVYYHTGGCQLDMICTVVQR